MYGKGVRCLSSMVRRVACLLVIANGLWLTGCQKDEDRSLTDREVNESIYDLMEENYLWYDELPAREEVDFGAVPEDFFYSLLLEKDGKNGEHYSWIVQTESFSLGGSAIFGYGLMYLNPSLMVLFVYPETSAKRSGIQRGDFIKAIGGVKVTKDNIVDVLGKNVDETIFTVERWNDEQGKREDMDILMPKREMYYDRPVYLDTVYTSTHIGKVGYLVYHEKFASGPDEEPGLYNDELKRAFVRFHSAGVKYFILDLRGNKGGDVSVCRLLSTMLAPREAMGKIFVVEKKNDQRENTVELFDPDVIGEGAGLDLEKLVVIVNQVSASASELIVHCLKPYFGDRLQVVGTRTRGKNVGMKPIEIPGSPWTIVPLTFYFLNCNGEYHSTDGLESDVYVEEDLSKIVYPLGDRREQLLRKAMQAIGAE